MHCSFLEDDQGPIMCGVHASSRVAPADCNLRNGIRIHTRSTNGGSNADPRFNWTTATTVAEWEHVAAMHARLAKLKFAPDCPCG